MGLLVYKYWGFLVIFCGFGVQPEAKLGAKRKRARSKRGRARCGQTRSEGTSSTLQTTTNSRGNCPIPKQKASSEATSNGQAFGLEWPTRVSWLICSCQSVAEHQLLTMWFFLKEPRKQGSSRATWTRVSWLIYSWHSVAEHQHLTMWLFLKEPRRQGKSRATWTRVSWLIYSWQSVAEQRLRNVTFSLRKPDPGWKFWKELWCARAPCFVSRLHLSWLSKKISIKSDMHLLRPSSSPDPVKVKKEESSPTSPAGGIAERPVLTI